MPLEFVQSRQNPRVQNLARLRERAHRDAQERFLVEGRRELERALAGGSRSDRVEMLSRITDLFVAGAADLSTPSSI